MTSSSGRPASSRTVPERVAYGPVKTGDEVAIGSIVGLLPDVGVAAGTGVPDAGVGVAVGAEVAAEGALEALVVEPSSGGRPVT